MKIKRRIVRSVLRATVPILMCAELHLICSACHPKVAKCPECRLVYGDKPRRHRYAEKASEELSRLNTERQELTKKSQS